MSRDRRRTDRLEERLEAVLAPVLSFSRTVEPLARGLCALPRTQQSRALRWIGITAATSAELAYRLAERLPAVLFLPEAVVADWVRELLDVFDHHGLEGASVRLAGAPGHGAAPVAAAVALGEVARRLELLLHGLSGRPLAVAAAAVPYTDTETVYLPAVIDRSPRREENIALYRALTLHLWGETRYGTWQVPMFLHPPDAAERLWRDGRWELLPDRDAGAGAVMEGDRLRAIFQRLEGARIDACLTRELPGSGRLLAALAGAGLPPADTPWGRALARAMRPGATVRDSYRQMAALHDEPLPPSPEHHGTMQPAAVEAVRGRRVRLEAARFRALRRRVPALAAAGEQRAHDRSNDVTEMFSGGVGSPPDQGATDTPMVTRGTRSLADSIVQDFGEMPSSYLDAEGDGLYLWHPDAEPGTAEPEPDDRAQGAPRYPEWNYLRRDYHRDWCQVREHAVAPVETRFADETRIRHQGTLKRLRRLFARLQDEPRWVRRQRDGDEVDLDAAVAALADLHHGEEGREGLYQRRHKIARDIAVCFLVDLSGSTKGWVNRAEREALVLLCEALQALDDRYAVYGFTGMTRHRCEVYRVKGFDEPYDERVRGRIGALQPGEYTRMGAAIRHLTRLLSGVEARVRLLVTVSDGKPDDFDGYRGRYGIEDTRRALAEAMARGIHSFGITLEREARDYLPRLYGETHYVVVDDAAALPLRLATYYGRITA